jgi:hypothetical protein
MQRLFLSVVTLRVLEAGWQPPQNCGYRKFKISRNGGVASESVASGGASFLTVVKTADLRDREHSAQLRRMHFPCFRRVLLQ